MGFYRLPGSPNRCVSCALTSGTFANSTLATACSLCSNRPASSTYYLVPMAVGGFNAASNNCPW